ncbi:hypothetical protein GALMADRAFT_141282 [Galerina marginata CBS 339.88]|uniref:DUF6532 domain-containing protein n=1 Tax=Galerina marginata (strain CBS 339.88) TaxID=685588 RepID=A0A067STC2_GALM3|nr:hypothetical protein GALMADRAFT_141282 [Galerina marginata CBS 339.88]
MALAVSRSMHTLTLCARYPVNQLCIYHALITQLLVNKIFRNKTDDGVTNPEFSEDGKLPMVTIALALSGVENNLDEWDWMFQAHLKRLDELDKKTQEADIIPRLCKHLLKMARHAKVTDTAVGLAEAGWLLDADVEAAKKKWEGLVLSDKV